MGLSESKCNDELCRAKDLFSIHDEFIIGNYDTICDVNARLLSLERKMLDIEGKLRILADKFGQLDDQITMLNKKMR